VDLILEFSDSSEAGSGWEMGRFFLRNGMKQQIFREDECLLHFNLIGAFFKRRNSHQGIVRYFAVPHATKW